MRDRCPESKTPTVLPNPVPEPYIGNVLVGLWGLAPELACKLAAWREELACARPAPLIVYVTSGRRTRSHQACLATLGYQTADPALSTHVPADTGPYAGYAQGVDVDLMPDTDEAWRAAGLAATRVGLRWGGGSAVDSRTLIPQDRWHFDMGRKRT